MLNKTEKGLLDSYIKAMEGMQPDQMAYWMTLKTFKWLAKKLKETNEELTVVMKKLDEAPVLDRGRQNPISVQTSKGTAIIATWEVNKYQCVFCRAWFLEVEAVKIHAPKHLEVI
jgi:hypothetical protein